MMVIPIVIQDQYKYDGRNKTWGIIALKIIFDDCHYIKILGTSFEVSPYRSMKYVLSHSISGSNIIIDFRYRCSCHHISINLFFILN